jgi:hypothetical protein
MYLQISNARLVQESRIPYKYGRHRNNIIWMKKNDKQLIYVPFELRKNYLFAVQGELLTGHDGVKKCKESLMECYFFKTWTRTF